MTPTETRAEIDRLKNRRKNILRDHRTVHPGSQGYLELVIVNRQLAAIGKRIHDAVHRAREKAARAFSDDFSDPDPETLLRATKELLRRMPPGDDSDPTTLRRVEIYRAIGVYLDSLEDT